MRNSGGPAGGSNADEEAQLRHSATFRAMQAKKRDEANKFELVDADHDGVISKDELRAAMRRQDSGVTEAKVNEEFSRLDANHDGGVSRREFGAAKTMPSSGTTGLLEKKILSSVVFWEARQACLTQSSLYFSIVGDDFVCDEIPLHEITNVFIDGDAKGDGGTSEDKKTLVIRTDINGFNSGRTYIHRTKRPEDLLMWNRELNVAVRIAKVEHSYNQEIAGKSSLFRVVHSLRRGLRTIHEGKVFQICVGIIILCSFALDIAEAELLPDKDSLMHEWFVSLDMLFTFMFVLELALNLFTHSYQRFKSFREDSWNVLDLVIVTVAVATLLLSESGSTDGNTIKMFRLIKIFRIVRLFRRLKSLNRIVVALSAAIIPVLNSFVILLLVTCIYATLATHLFGKGTEADSIFFTKFSVSLFSMFQVVTGDSWASAITRSLFDLEGSANDQAVALFFVSYVLIAGLVLVNVVMTVLLDQFLASITQEKEDYELKMTKEAEACRISGVLDPLSSSLTRFNDVNDLHTQIQDTFARLDEDGSGGLDFKEFKERVNMLPTSVPIHLMKDDFDMITKGGALLNENGEFGALEFRDMIRGELLRFAQRQCTYALQESHSKESKAMILMLKLLELNVAEIKAAHESGLQQMQEQVAQNHAEVMESLNGLLGQPAAGSSSLMRDGNIGHNSEMEEAPMVDFTSPDAGEADGGAQDFVMKSGGAGVSLQPAPVPLLPRSTPAASPPPMWTEKATERGSGADKVARKQQPVRSLKHRHSMPQLTSASYALPLNDIHLVEPRERSARGAKRGERERGKVKGGNGVGRDDWGRDLRDKLIALHADAEHVSERSRRSGYPLRDSQGHSKRGTSAHRVGVLPGYQVPLTRDTAEGIDSLLKANSISDLMSSHRSNRTL